MELWVPVGTGLILKGMILVMMKEMKVYSSMDTGQVMSSMRRLGMRVEHQGGSDSAITDTHRCGCCGMIAVADWHKLFGEIEAMLSYNTEGDSIRLWSSLQGKDRNGKIGFMKNHGGGTGMPELTRANVTDMEMFGGRTRRTQPCTREDSSAACAARRRSR